MGRESGEGRVLICVFGGGVGGRIGLMRTFILSFHDEKSLENAQTSKMKK